MGNSVEHPSHYQFENGMEVLDFIKIITEDFDDGYEGFLVGNILKYTARYPWKNGIEDVKKTKYYADELIKYLETKDVVLFNKIMDKHNRDITIHD